MAKNLFKEHKSLLESLKGKAIKEIIVRKNGDLSIRIEGSGDLIYIDRMDNTLGFRKGFIDPIDLNTFYKKKLYEEYRDDSDVPGDGEYVGPQISDKLYEKHHKNVANPQKPLIY